MAPREKEELKKKKEKVPEERQELDPKIDEENLSPVAFQRNKQVVSRRTDSGAIEKGQIIDPTSNVTLSDEFPRRIQQARRERGMRELNPAEIGQVIQTRQARGVDVSNFENYEEEQRQQLVNEAMQEYEQALQETDPTAIEQEFEAGGGFQELEPKVEKGKQTIVEWTAEQGLKVPIGISNLIEDGFTKLTGIETKRGGTAEELSKTTFGKVLGLSTVGVLAVQGGASVAAMAGATAGGGVGGILASLGGKISAISGKVGVVGGLGLYAAGDIGISFISDLYNIETDLVVDKILEREGAEEVQGQINTQGQRASTITGLVESNTISTEQGLARIDQLESSLNILRHKAQKAAIADERVLVSDKYGDIIGDLEDQMDTLEEQRGKILAADPRYDPNTAALIMQQIKEQQEKDLQYLRSKGYTVENLRASGIVN